MKCLSVIASMSLAIATGTAVAQPPPPPPGYAPSSSGAAYGTAGCGLGSIVFGNKPGFNQVFAATTNGTGGQTFAITSGTSNCGSGGSGGVAARSFIETNREAFAKDVSRGSGETIASVATLSGCADARAVGVHLQRNFKAIFPTAKATNTEISAAAVRSLKSDKTLACARLI